jgi:hypothetical protein
MDKKTTSLLDVVSMENGKATIQRTGIERCIAQSCGSNGGIF